MGRGLVRPPRLTPTEMLAEAAAAGMMRKDLEDDCQVQKARGGAVLRSVSKTKRQSNARATVLW